MEELIGIASIAIIVFIAIVGFTLDYKIEKLLKLNYKIEEMLRKGSSQTKQSP